MKKIQTVFVLMAIVSLNGCASRQVKTACQESDWFEIGRSQGSMGRSAKPDKRIKPVCSSSDKNVVRSLYQNGHRSGLMEFCVKEIGFDLGHSGQAYNNVCPTDREVEFLAAYNRGQRVRNLELSHEKIHNDLEKMSRLLAQDGLTTPEQEFLQKKKSDLQREQQALQSEIDSALSKSL